MSGPQSPDEVPFVPFSDAAGEASVFSCPLCGVKFTHGVMACASCPLNAGCEVVKCPHCGYQYPRDSKIVGWARRLVRLGGGAR